MRELAKEIKELAGTLKEVEEQLKAELLQVPNLPDLDLPVGSTESDNRSVREEERNLT